MAKPNPRLPTIGKIVLQAVLTVLPVTAIMIAVTWTEVFTGATVELGLAHYAEKHPPWLPSSVVRLVPMPLNTIVNIGYVVYGLIWAQFIAECYQLGRVKHQEAYSCLVFNTMSVIYGFVQLNRIVFQTRASAVLDQWCTLPFFMFVHVWAKTFTGPCRDGTFYALMLTSVASFAITFFTTVGFEIALGCHIVVATVGSVSAYLKYGSRKMTRSFCLALMCCAGFVILKLLDHWLAARHWIFMYISGHFLSKICDVLQIHYVNQFFYYTALARVAESTHQTNHKKAS